MRITLILGTIVVVSACNGPAPGDESWRLPGNRNFTPMSREPGLTISGHVDVGIVKEL